MIHTFRYHNVFVAKTKFKLRNDAMLVGEEDILTSSDKAEKVLKLRIVSIHLLKNKRA